MKKIALLSTFCDTPEKIEVLVENSRILKSLGVDVMVNSPLNLDPEVVKEFDFYFKNKENPVLTWPDRIHTAWRVQTNEFGQTVKIIRGMREYSWAALYQIKKLSEFALSYDYDIFYHMNYDILLDDELKKEILSESRNKIYPVKDERTGHIWQGSPLLSSFDRGNLQKISEDITKERYKNGYSIAEDFVHSWVEKFGLIHSSYYAKDRISLDKNSDIFSEVRQEDVLDYSKNSSYKLFWNKEEGLNLKILIWNFDRSKKISISVNNSIFTEIETLVPIETNFLCEGIFDFSVICDDYVMDYLKEYQETIVNWINVD